MVSDLGLAAAGLQREFFLSDIPVDGSIEVQVLPPGEIFTVGDGLTYDAARNSVKVSEFLSADRMQQVVEDTKVGGATLTKLLGTSAWYAPGAAVSGLVQAIAMDLKKIYPCSALLEGEFGLNDLCIGVPVVLGRNGIEKIVEIELSAEEKAKLAESAEGVKKTNGLLNT